MPDDASWNASSSGPRPRPQRRSPRGSGAAGRWRSSRDSTGSVAHGCSLVRRQRAPEPVGATQQPRAVAVTVVDRSAAMFEIVLSGGTVVRVGRGFDEVELRRLLATVVQSG